MTGTARGDLGSPSRPLFVVAVAVLAVFGLAGCTGGGDVHMTPTAGPGTSSSVSPAVLPVGHGRVVVDASGLDRVTYAPLADGDIGEAEESRVPNVVLPAGDYVITVYRADKTVYAANVTVMDQAVQTVVPVTRPQQFARVLESAWNYVVPLGDDRFLTYSRSGSAQLGVTGQETGEPFFSYDEVWSACPAGGGRVMVFGDAGPAVYNPATRAVSPLTSDMVNLDLETKNTIGGARCVRDATQFDVGGSLARVALSGTELIELPDYPARFASGLSGGVLADAATNAVAVITGNDHYGSVDDRVASDMLEQSLLVIAGQDDLQVRTTIGLGRRDDITDVQFSPGGGRVAVQFDTFIRVYDTATTRLLYTIPARWSRFFWLDDNCFIYQGDPDTRSLFEANVDTRESYGLHRTDTVEISVQSTYVDGYLYLTGADQLKLEESGSAELRGYRIALE